MSTFTLSVYRLPYDSSAKFQDDGSFGHSTQHPDGDTWASNDDYGNEEGFLAIIWEIMAFLLKIIIEILI